MQLNSSSWLELSNVDFKQLLSVGGQYAESLINQLNNPFWKDLLGHWAFFCEKVKTESVKQILDSPLWFNSNFNIGNRFIKVWFQKGITTIYDLIDRNGNWYDFERLKEACGIKSTFLNYLNVLNCIPNAWKDVINEDKVYSILKKDKRKM